jgi:hypothetical protein
LITIVDKDYQQRFSARTIVDVLVTYQTHFWMRTVVDGDFIIHGFELEP